MAGRTILCRIPHATPLISIIAAGLGLAFLLGMIAARLRLPPLIGYLSAGIIIGPFTPGFVADSAIASELAEIGVSLLMFGVGLHFSLRDLLAVRNIAVPGAAVQILVATLMGAALARSWGWSLGAGLVFGLALSVASTVVLLRAMGEQRKLETVEGRVAVGWLIVEDLAMVVALVALPALAVYQAQGFGVGGLGGQVAWTLVKVGAFLAAMFVVGKKVVPRLLGRAARMRAREHFTVGVLAVALGIAFGASALFGISPALGAFFAGMVISESDLSHQASAETLPLRESFTVLFFVSVGMLFDPSVLVKNPGGVLLSLAVVMVGKSVAAAFIVLLFRHPIATALTVSASLAQIGEFSFILASLGTGIGVLPPEARSIIVAVAILSITLNPLFFRMIPSIVAWLQRRPRLVSMLERKQLPPLGHEVEPGMHGHVVIVGYGRVGATIGRALASKGIPFVVVENDKNVVEALHAGGIRALFGDASRPGILSHTGVERASLLVVAAPDKAQAREILSMAWAANPDIDTCVRTHSFEQADAYRELGVRSVVMGEEELALRMAEYALASAGVPEDEAAGAVLELRASSKPSEASEPP